MMLSDDNFFTSGPIPPALGGLTALSVLHLAENQLSGEFTSAVPILLHAPG